MISISPDALVRLVIFLLYVPVILICYWRLIPRLSPVARLLATIMIAAQALAILLSLENQAAHGNRFRFWDLNYENNFPTALASTQLALVSLVAIATAWLARTQPSWRRLYLVGLSLAFLYLAWEEHSEMRRLMFVGKWEIYYIALGLAILAATTIVAIRSSMRSRIWHICLLSGLAVSAAGSFGIEELRYEEVCQSLGLVGARGCHSYHIEESLEFLGIWLILLAMLGQLSELAPRLRRRHCLILYLVPAFTFAALLLTSQYVMRHLSRAVSTQLIQLEYQFQAQPISAEFESDLRLLAFRTEREADTLALWLYASTSSWNAYTGLGYSVQLIDQVTGEPVASVDQIASRKMQWQPGRETWLYKERIALEVPPSRNPLWIVQGIWRGGGGAFVPQRVLSTDRQLQSETRVILGQLETSVD